MPKQESKYRSISVSQEDYELFEQIASELSQEKQVKVSVPRALRLGMEFYKAQRKGFDL